MHLFFGSRSWVRSYASRKEKGNWRHCVLNVMFALPANFLRLKGGALFMVNFFIPF